MLPPNGSGAESYRIDGNSEDQVAENGMETDFAPTEKEEPSGHRALSSSKKNGNYGHLLMAAAAYRPKERTGIVAAEPPMAMSGRATSYSPEEEGFSWRPKK